jgi:hypothetical protein
LSGPQEVEAFDRKQAADVSIVKRDAERKRPDGLSIKEIRFIRR